MIETLQKVHYRYKCAHMLMSVTLIWCVIVIISDQDDFRSN